MVSQRIVKTHLQVFSGLTVLSLILLLSACGPAPNPKLQAQSAEPAPAPAVQQPEAAPAPVEQPRPELVAKPTRETTANRVIRQTVRQTPASRPDSGIAESAARSEGSSERRTMTLPAPLVAPPDTQPVPPVDEVVSKPIEPPAPKRIVVPSGTVVSVRMIDSVDSETATVGETFKASLDEPIVVDGEMVFPTGSEVYVKLSKVQSAGRVSGKSELQLQLDRISLGSRSYLLDSSTYVSTGASQTGRTARSAGLGAAIGAAIGAISGGGKGAAIGAATGAGAGAGVEAIRKGEQVRVDSETKLDFRLEESLEVTLQSPSSSQRNNPSGPLRFGTRQ